MVGLHHCLKHSDVAAAIERVALIVNRWDFQWPLAHCPLPYCLTTRHPDIFRTLSHIDRQMWNEFTISSNVWPPWESQCKKLFCYFAHKQSAKRWLLKFNGRGGRKKLNSLRGLRIVAQVAGAEQISAHLLNLPDLPDLQPEKYLHIEPCEHMEQLIIPFCICCHFYS